MKITKFYLSLETVNLGSVPRQYRSSASLSSMERALHQGPLSIFLLRTSFESTVPRSHTANAPPPPPTSYALQLDFATRAEARAFRSLFGGMTIGAFQACVNQSADIFYVEGPQGVARGIIDCIHEVMRAVKP